MIHSQNELDVLWLKLKGQIGSDYATGRITRDLDLVQSLQLDVLRPSDSLARASSTISYTRRRENADAEWGPWEEGYSVAV
jgi:hypothetical protein